MSQPTALKKFPPAPPPRTNLNAVVGVVFSAVGLVGWIVTLVTLFSFQYDQNASSDGMRELARSMNNGAVYLSRVATGLVGLALFGFCSGVGTIVSTLGLNDERRQLAFVGLGLGVAGLNIGCGLIVWRMVAWGFFP